jgi:hypothetical protein
MVALGGTVRAVELLLIATTVELAAAWLKETVQVVEALLPILAGEHEIEVSDAGTAVAVNPNDWDAPLKDAAI